VAVRIKMHFKNQTCSINNFLALIKNRFAQFLAPRKCAKKEIVKKELSIPSFGILGRLQTY
jgi:hypothetical protein